MSVNHDVRSNLLMLVGLLNTAPGVVAVEDEIATPEGLGGFAARHDFSGRLTASALDVVAAVDLRERFATALRGDAETVVEAVNLTFRETRALPQLVRHDDWDWHLHGADTSAPLSERMAIDIALVLVDLIRSDDLDRLRWCAAEDCSAALADLTRNRSKRFCDTGNCANRTHVAAYRARHDR